jgi:two-component system OmpR family response regulator
VPGRRETVARKTWDGWTMVPEPARSGEGAGVERAQSPSEASILVVDDDAQLRQILAKLLRSGGYKATLVGSGREMMEALRTVYVDLIILDVMLPGASGIELCRQVRQTSSVPIMMLTARSEETDRVLGLEMGADDYLTKPFSSRELLARVRALLRRAAGAPNLVQVQSGTKYGFEGWIVDTLRRELANPDGVVVDLSSGEYDLLLAFVEAPQRVLSREQLLDLARNRTAVPGFDRSIDVQISRLRRKMGGEDAEGFIKTVRGAGYLFVPAVLRL